VLKDIENTTKPVFDHPMYRVYPKTKQELLEEGVEYPDDTELELIQNPEQLHYIGNKWGGKYLRAPEIYFKILEKGKDKLVRLNDIALIMGYIHGFNVGPLFPKVKFVESISKLDSIYLDENSKGVIDFGVKKDGNSREISDLLYPRMFGDRFLVIVNFGKIYGQKFYKIILKNKELKTEVGLFLNSTLSILQNEVLLYSTWGLGGISINSDHLYNMFVLLKILTKNDLLNRFFKRKIYSIFTELGFDKTRPIREQEPNPLPDRKELDDIVFDALGLTEEERKEVYWAVAELVKARLDKAKSV